MFVTLHDFISDLSLKTFTVYYAYTIWHLHSKHTIFYSENRIKSYFKFNFTKLYSHSVWLDCTKQSQSDERKPILFLSIKLNGSNILF